MANGNRNRIKQGSLVCNDVEHDSREMCMHENLVTRVVQIAKLRLEDKVWKVGNMATKIMGLVVYNVALAKAYVRTKWHLDPSSR